MVTPYTNAVLNGMSSPGADITVMSCTSNESNRHWGEVGPKSYSHRVMPGFSIAISGNRFAHINRNIHSTLDCEGPDVLVINGFYPSMLIAARWAKSRGVPLMLTIDGWAETMPNTIYHTLARRYVLSSCAGVIVCGLKGKAYFAGLGFPEDRITIAPLAPAWDPPSAISCFQERPYDLLWAAHLDQNAKNVAFLVDIARNLKSRIPDFRVRIVGSGPEKASVLSALTDLKVDFTHTDSVEWHEMRGIFETSKTMILPSLWEPWGLVCNESMNCGTPCIVSRHVGAAGDLIVSGRNGLVLDLDVEAWSTAIQTLCSDEASWTKMSEHANSDSTQRSSIGTAEITINAIKSAARMGK